MRRRIAGTWAHSFLLARAAIVVILLVGTACGRAPEDRTPFDATVTIDLDSPGKPVNRKILGNNVQWVDHGDELLAMDSVQFVPRMLEKVQTLGPTVLRYPGGCQADTYRWQNGIGELKDRKPNQRFFDSRKEKPLLGTREFLELCQRTGAEPLITVNVATGSAEEAAAWVEYVNKQGVLSSTGEPLPKVKYWEIGNEPYLTNDKQPKLAIQPEEYARRADEFIAKMKAVDPSIEVMIPLRSDRIGGKPATPYQGFADKVLSSLKADFEHVAVHDAYLPAAFGGAPKGDELYLATLSGSAVVAADLADTRKLLEKYRPGKTVGIAVTEYSSLFTIGRSTDGYIASPLGALYVADLLRVLAEDESVTMANFWSLTGNWYFGAISNRGMLRPSYHVLEAFNRFFRGNLLPVNVDGPTYSAPAVGFIPAKDNTPVITALAVRNGASLRVLLINKDLSRKGRLQIHGTVQTVGKDNSSKAPAPIVGSKLSFLLAEDPFEVAKGNAEGWQAVDLKASSFPVELDLPAHSLALLELELGEPPKP